MGINLINNQSSFLNISNDTNLNMVISTNQDQNNDITFDLNIPTFNEFITALCIFSAIYPIRH